MNSGKDIFTAFKEGSERLTVQPSAQAWQHLERRLDSQPKRLGRVVMMRWLSAAAAILVLVAGVWFVNDLSNSTNSIVENEPTPKFLEDLVNTDGCNPYCLLIKERKALPSYYANPVRN